MSELQELADWLKEDFNPEAAAYDFGYEIVLDELYDTTRWSNIQITVFKDGDKYYQLLAEHPATEYQEGGEFNRTLEEVTAEEVVTLKFTPTGNESIDWEATSWSS